MSGKYMLLLLVLGLVVSDVVFACAGGDDSDPGDGSDEKKEEASDEEKSDENKSDDKSGGSDEECLDDEDEEVSDACNSNNLREILKEALTTEENLGDPNKSADAIDAAAKEAYPCAKWIVFCTEATVPASAVEHEKKDCADTIGKMTCRVYAD